MKRKFFAVTALIAIGSPLLAQQDSSILNLDEVVVTASKTPQKQSATGKVITVITKEQLEKSAGKSLAQVLNEQAGVVVNGSLNNPGSVQTLFLRGASNGRALILVDGIPVNDPSTITNDFDLNHFSIQDAERIEICKGAQSTLYGSDAIAGVINIITIKKDLKTPFGFKTTNSVGNRNSIRNHFQGYGKAGKFQYNARFSNYTTDGFSSATTQNGNSGLERDGYDGHTANASLQYESGTGFSIRPFVQYSRYQSDVDAGVFADDRDYWIRNKNITSGVNLRYQKGRVTLVGNYQYGELSRIYLNDSLHTPGFTFFEDNRYDGRTQFAEFFGNIRLNKFASLLAGTDYRWGNMSQYYFSVSGFGPYLSQFDDTSMNQVSGYASLFLHFLNEDLNIELGGRLNSHSKYGGNSTFTINPSYRINAHFRAFGSVASGFKAPTIYQLFDVFSGTPSLNPERSINYELGIQHTGKKWSNRIVYFYRDIDNGLDFDYNSFVYFNFVKQKVHGVEYEFAAQPTEKLTLSGNYTFLGGKETTQSRKNFSDTTYNYLLRRPQHAVNFTLGYQFNKKLDASLTARSISKRYDLGGYQMEDVKLDGYFLLNAHIQYKWREHIRFFADGQNLLDKTFFDLRGYNSLPFTVVCGLAVDIK